MWKKILTSEETSYSKWWDGLSSHTKESLKNQPIWRDSDIVTAVLVGLGVGLFIGFALFYAWPAPVTAPLHYVTG
jgi:F0F1-type ATP synthase assembly protein I